MRSDILRLFKEGKLTTEDLVTEMITGVGSGVYTYMVMLENDQRESEARFYADIRTKVFDIRSRFSKILSQEQLDKLSAEMQIVYEQLKTAETFLRAHKSPEASLLQSVVNDSGHISHIIRTYREPIEKNF